MDPDPCKHLAHRVLRELRGVPELVCAGLGATSGKW